MGLIEVLLIGIGLSMDAFAVSVCKGLSFKKITAKNTLTVGAYFGFFQALMPVIGYFVGSVFAGYVKRFDHIIAFVLLLYIGGKMIYEALKDETEGNSDSLKFTEMLILSIATSIDALAVGVTFALNKGGLNIFVSAGIIGVTTFLIACVGVLLGKKGGEFLQRKAEIAGGIILIAIGAKILIEHTFFGG